MKCKLILIYFIFYVLSSCSSINQNPPATPDSLENNYVRTSDGTRIFVYTYTPKHKLNTTIYIISGYTGINHNTEKDIIELLSGGKYKIVIIHPRGTGYSEGVRGDVNNYSLFLNDFSDIINKDIANNKSSKVILYGHSISTAIALSIIPKLFRIDGTILVNPPYKMKHAPGMTPSMADYIKYIFYMVFAPHTPIVNMVGEPSKIQNNDERIEAESRSSDPLLVKYISMYMMMESKMLLDKMINFASNANCPLLLLYGSEDSIIEKSGCDEIFKAWSNSNKVYRIIDNGPHGKLTVIKSKKIIHAWLNKI